ncbi:phosphoribosyltransferase [Fodinibius salsisoli]|uniref:Phosphoribosyltransferase n=1 Tax=Fodinibius salsisoli TaxID=2820877 RepID=A0ABT3PIF1_9BACT|nr:phosphoribosyltransferase family protein [Fodinibius salsisoli]MCW9705706.1 phosphoribosyltransferase [Fodinibius salsisoli]
MFADRKQAGVALGKALQKYEKVKPIVLAIPRGGVVVGYYVALALECDFDVIITRKLGYPEQPEAGFGAIAEDGSLYLDPWSNRYISKDIITKVQAREAKEVQRRIQTYRDDRVLPTLEGRVVILVDDGIATGATMMAAIRMCTKKNAEKIVVAAPVSAIKRISKLEGEADEVIILFKSKQLTAVSQGYRDFSNLSDEDVIPYLKKWYKLNKDRS